MSERHEAQAAFCGLHNASDGVLEIVQHAIDGEANEIGSLWSYATIAKTREALETCRYLGCSIHASERDAVKVLRGLMDEAEAEDAAWELERAEKGAAE